MPKKLSKMTLEELWQLFPIILKPPTEEWRKWYEEESKALSAALNGIGITSINHIGSTAIKGIWAKPTVDILVETAGDMNEAAMAIRRCGYTEMSRSDTRISFNKGYTKNGFADRVFHLHLRHAGDNAEIRFRDYLNAHPDVAKEYEKLKLSLWKKYEHDRDGYTDAKTGFINNINQIAKDK